MAETLIKGYHLFALCGKNPTESLRFENFTNLLGNNRQTTRIFGSKTGLRSWQIPLSGSTDTAERVVTFRGRDYPYASYIQSLYAWQESTGGVFVIQSPVNDNYYFAKIENPSLALQKLGSKIYDITLEVKQVEIQDKFVFDVSKVSGVWGWYDAIYFDDDWNDNEPIVDTSWGDYSGNNNSLAVVNTGATFQTNEVNSLPAVSLDGNSVYLNRDEAVLMKQAFFVLKFPFATFSRNHGILSGSTSPTTFLVSSATGTKFFDLGIEIYEYYKNSVAFASNDQQAPMNTYGIISARIPEGIALDKVRIGKQTTFSDRNANVLLAEIILCDQVVKETDFNEIMQYLTVKYSI